MAQEESEKLDQQKAKKSDPKARQLTLKEYEELKAKRAQKSRGFKIPKPILIILSIPFLLIFCFGLVFLPWISFKIATSPTVDTKKQTSGKMDTKKYP